MEDNSGSTFWQLEDDSEFAVRMEPWPVPDGGEITLHATTHPGDWGGNKPVVEQVYYQISPSAEPGSDWKSMGAPREETDSADGDSWTSHHYKVENVKLPSGEAYVQFKVEGENLTRFNVLSDWKVKVP